MEAAEAEGAEVGVKVEEQTDFMTVLLEHAGGDVSLVEAAMTSACRAADEADLGGGKRPGKMLLSPGKDKVVVCCHVPESHHDNVTADAWMQVVMVGTGGEKVKGDNTLALGIIAAGKTCKQLVKPLSS